MFLLKPVIILIPLEEEEVQVIVVLGEKVAQNTVWVATFNLVGREAKIDTLNKVPKLSDRVPVEPPVEQKDTNREEEINENILNCFIYSLDYKSEIPQTVA